MFVLSDLGVLACTIRSLYVWDKVFSVHPWCNIGVRWDSAKYGGGAVVCTAYVWYPLQFLFCVWSASYYMKHKVTLNPKPYDRSCRPEGRYDAGLGGWSQNSRIAL